VESLPTRGKSSVKKSLSDCDCRVCGEADFRHKSAIRHIQVGKPDFDGGTMAKKKRKTKNEKRKTKNEKRKTKNEKRKTKNEKRKTKNEKRKTKMINHHLWL
jgi:hypothetical protein